MCKTYDRTVTIAAGKYGTTALIIHWKPNYKTADVMKHAKRYYLKDASAKRLIKLINDEKHHNPYVSICDGVMRVALTFIGVNHD